MSEVVIKDSSIKLFGRTIFLPPCNNEDSSANGFSSDEPAPLEDCSHHSPPSSSSFPREVSSTMEHEAESYKEPSRKELTSTQEEEASHETSEEPKSPTSSCNLENPKTPSTERETSLLKSSKNGDQSDTTTTTTTSMSQDKTLKKPDKVLPCPRCNSMDTKFCYYNNYNVNQPRHFCKHCQRYWTAGGTMRNVPVGAGRRKNKNSSSVPQPQPQHYRQIMAFGSDHSPLSDSVASVLSLAEKTTQNGVLNGFHSPKQNTNGDEHQYEYEYDANVMASTFKEKRENATISHEESLDSHMSYHHHHQGFTTPQLCFPGSSTSSSSPWPYPWNPAMAPSAFCHHVPFYPTPAFWGCMPHPSWSVNYQSAPGSGPNSPTLGKHSRDGDILFQKPTSTESKSNMEENSTVLIPKTLRIDDPTEAAKSSIWSTLGIKNEKRNSLNGGGLFKAFASKGSDDNNNKKNNHVMVEAASPVLQANPAALSRSLVFHERT